jgi:hypothetical protein
MSCAEELQIRAAAIQAAATIVAGHLAGSEGLYHGISNNRGQGRVARWTKQLADELLDYYTHSTSPTDADVCSPNDGVHVSGAGERRCRCAEAHKM